MPRWSGVEGTSFDAFLRDVGRHSVLTAEQERSLSRLVVEARTRLWCALLDFTPLTERIAIRLVDTGACEGMGGDLSALVDAAARRQSSACGDTEFAIACRSVAGKLALRRTVDLARKLVVCFSSDAAGHHGAAEHAAMLVPVLRSYDVLRDRFANANMRLVVSVAKKLRSWNRAMPMEDMVQEGSLGLVRAVDTFDPERGVKFSTYGVWWIRHMIVRGAIDRGRMIRVPSHMHDRAYKLMIVARELHDQTGEWPTPEETAAAAGMPLAKAMAAYDAFGGGTISEDSSIVSIDTWAWIDDDRERDVVLPFMLEASDSDPEAVVAVRRDVADMMSVIDSDLFDDRDRLVLRRRAGLDGDAKTNLDVIARELHLSRERVRQLEHRAVERLRRVMIKRRAAA